MGKNSRTCVNKSMLSDFGDDCAAILFYNSVKRLLKESPAHIIIVRAFRTSFLEIPGEPLLLLSTKASKDFCAEPNWLEGINPSLVFTRKLLSVIILITSWSIANFNSFL